jgi:phosphatidylethanolamine-binding protein (PEBP) family uncharacterized protein
MMALGLNAKLDGAIAQDLSYTCSKPRLSVIFDVAGRHYSGEVNCGNLFLETDIPSAPRVTWKSAKSGKFYTLMMLDFDGNANGSWPEPVPSGANSPVRHWIVGNIPGEILRKKGYAEPSDTATVSRSGVSILQPYRSPHIPVVSDRYAVYLFEQAKRSDFKPLSGPITNFDHKSFMHTYGLEQPIASNYFVAVYVSESPFSGKAFHGNDVSQTWHKDYGKGNLTPDH